MNQNNKELIDCVEITMSQLTDDRLEPGLYIVSTPIGNLGDITLRALSVLHQADVIYCEDTRHSRKLFSKFGIKRPLKNYHEHNAVRERPIILDRITKGGRVVLISDAGTPLISDPGFKLVREVRDAGLHLTAVPGPTSPVCALPVSGLPTDRFYFEGFLPAKATQRRSRLQAVDDINVTMVFLESAKRLNGMLADTIDILGDRSCVVARELTKKFEEVWTGKLSDLITRAEQQKPRGEFVILVAGKDTASPDRQSIENILSEAMLESGLSRAAKDIADAYGIKRKIIYDIGLELKRKDQDHSQGD